MRKLTFSKLGKYGRLGNSMFQIAGTIGLARKHGMQAVFPKWKYARYFAPHRELVFSPAKGSKLTEKHFHHHEWQIPSRGDVDISGYLQSEKYFHGECPLKFRSGFLRILREKHKALFTKPTLGIQIRRGDYVNNPNYAQLTMGYFISAMQKHFPDWQNRNVCFFCEDVQYAKLHFSCMPNAHFVEANDIDTLGLMTMMDGMIISNSSYGWWGAYFAEKNNGAKVVRPSRHLDGQLAKSNDTKDLYPDRWLVHEWDSKVDLMDCTFTIPVSYDHKDREDNLRLTLDQLGRDFVTNVLIQEQSGRLMKFEGFRSSKNVIGVLHFKSKVFHRTKMLNEMAREAKTPYVSNWDADVLVAPMQIVYTMMALRDGKSQMVFPYDGIFARMERNPWYNRVVSQDIGVARATKFHGMTEGFISVGGAVFFNREYFLKRGGENERFISYGAEDLERVERFKKMGAAIHRVRGPLFHINHFVGPDSCKENPFFAANEREYKRICKMNRSQLEKEFLVG